MRENGYNAAIIEELWKEVVAKYPEEWLIALDIYELLLLKDYHFLAGEVKNHLEHISAMNPETSRLIADGIQLLHPDFVISLDCQ